MSNIPEILNGIGSLIVAIGAVVVLLKTSTLITVLSERVKEWKV
jgi:hypothetical protein